MSVVAILCESEQNAYFSALLQTIGKPGFWWYVFVHIEAGKNMYAQNGNHTYWEGIVNSALSYYVRWEYLNLMTEEWI